MRYAFFNDLYLLIIPLTIEQCLKDVDIKTNSFIYNIESFEELLEDLHPFNALLLARSFKFYYTIFLKNYLSNNNKKFKERQIRSIVASYINLNNKIDNSISNYESKVIH
ncbi:hypothetical protein [Spiroplasma turonicum]|uniref:Uncharacterized protein n=1 Tax=Spiroplasma turonicum TaxID=216946 RepID=A0A0K1P5L7_9MOLU|nr:hypothetical protein [Spiroplasma turonicum]AKU79479.1 hypothetical protein STURON_00233 [Spiroplasma turonicum]ALX70500.1 hypothetical protein STURO_v1c02320 [Spiroplasma turonicum]